MSDPGRDSAIRPRVSALRVPNLSEIDFVQLRARRLQRLQDMMKLHDLPVCLFYDTANIRYATGVDVMGVWTSGTFMRYCVVPADGLFEYRKSMHVAQKLVRDVRPAFTWQLGGVDPQVKAREWAQSIGSLLRDWVWKMSGWPCQRLRRLRDPVCRRPRPCALPPARDPGEHGPLSGVLRGEGGRAVRRQA